MAAGGAPAALVGVMEAVAPLAAAGFLLGAGHPEKAFGAVLLFAANVAGVDVAGVAQP
ncbi:hypothetical protein TTMY_2168 [Thermus thermophilus]|nr:hypothetical protein TTMY_2168 [Thermus thermophilus]BDB10767.1 hypothetical protein TthTMY_05060 [Thermus thermophilus]